MAWCPKCKCEYVAGVTVCADCGCELVEELPVQSEEVLEQLDEAEVFEEAEDAESVPDETGSEEEFAFDEEEPAPGGYKGAYINNEERAEENRTSAYTLLTVGGGGMIAVILFFCGIIDIRVTLISRYMITGVMGVLFLLFIIMGIISMRNSQTLRKKAYKENNLTLQIKKWCTENLSGAVIDETLQIGQLPDELKYFKRCDYMKKAINRQFMNLDENYVDRLIEEVYPETFEGKSE